MCKIHIHPGAAVSPSFWRAENSPAVPAAASAAAGQGLLLQGRNGRRHRVASFFPSQRAVAKVEIFIFWQTQTVFPSPSLPRWSLAPAATTVGGGRVARPEKFSWTKAKEGTKGHKNIGLRIKSERLHGVGMRR